MSRLLTNHDDDDIHLDEHVVDVDDQAHPMMPLTVDDGGLAANKKKTSWIRDPRTIAIVVLSTLLLVAVVAYGRAATLGHDDPASHDENTSEQVSETNWQPMVESQSIITRLEHLEYIAALNSGSRSVNTGLNMSSAYVAEELRLYTDFVVYEEHFRLAVPTEQFPAQFMSVLPTFVNYTHGTDFYPLSFEGAGDVQGNLTLMPQGLTGCNASHYTSLLNSNTVGTIMLFERGGCTFHEKANIAIDLLDVAGVLIYDSHDSASVIHGTLTEDYYHPNVPAFTLTRSLGEQLAAQDSPVVRMRSWGVVDIGYSQNVCADSPSGAPSNVVLVGAHLDSVDAGPGINDNGSGAMTILEFAIQMAQHGWSTRLQNQVRFCWWSAEELGLIGSTRYVKKQQEAGTLGDIAIYLNFDMTASPNAIRGVYHGSAPTVLSDYGHEVHLGSTCVEQLFNDHFNAIGLPTFASNFNGRSDYGPFIEAGVPAGGLDTGAEVLKTPKERDIFGGVANTAFDPCYHQKCDTARNVDRTVLDQNARAIVDVVRVLALSSSLRSSTLQCY